MTHRPNAEFMRLFKLFTSGEQSIGTRLRQQLGSTRSDVPLLLVTGSDMVFFPGGGRPPVTQDFRLSTRGFFEITAVSHLGIAVPYLARLRETGYGNWEADADELITQCRAVRAFNSRSYWSDEVAVDAWRGLESKICDLVDYTCTVTADYLERALRDPELLDFGYIRANLLEGDGPHALPVSFNDMMVATFALVALDTSYRTIRWLRAHSIEWEQLMVVISGRAGRLSAGLTWQTNSMCHLIYQASGQRLDPDRLLIAPFAPAVEVTDLDSPEVCRQVEEQYREIWYSSLSSVEMSRLVWPDYPAFKRSIEQPPAIESDTDVITEMPVVRTVDDKRAMVSRLRYVMEDPSAQLATAGSQFMIDQLCANGNRPDAVEIPGFTDTCYPSAPTEKRAGIS